MAKIMALNTINAGCNGFCSRFICLFFGRYFRTVSQWIWQLDWLYETVIEILRCLKNLFFSQQPNVFNELLGFELERAVLDTPNPFLFVNQQHMFGMQKIGVVFSSPSTLPPKDAIRDIDAVFGSQQSITAALDNDVVGPYFSIVIE